MKKTIKILLVVIGVFCLIACVSENIKGHDYDGEDPKQETKIDFPTKSIQIVVPYSPGGGTDFVARALADVAKKYFSKPVVVVNKTGDAGAVGMFEGANAEGDGHTVTMITVELVTLPNLGLAPFTYKNFKPVLQVNADPSALTVKADAPWNTVEEFLDYAKQNPRKLKIGNSGVGSIWHLAAAGIEKKMGVTFNHISYDGAAPAAVALLGGYIDAVTVSPGEVLTHVKNGELKVLGVLSNERIDSLPYVPTFKEQGYDWAIDNWRGLGVPKDTSDEIVSILEEGFAKAAEDQDFKDLMDKLGFGYKVIKGKEFEEKIKENNDFFKRLIKELGMKQ